MWVPQIDFWSPGIRDTSFPERVLEKVLFPEHLAYMCFPLKYFYKSSSK